MANVTHYVQTSETDTAVGLSPLFKALGNTKTFSSAWTIWALKAFSVSFGTAAVVGLTCQMSMALTVGPIIPFLVGSSVGFVGGMCHRWQVDKREALHALDEFPDIIQHHLMLLGPAQFHGLDMKEWRKDIHQNLYKQSLAISALYGASEVIARVRAEREEQLFRQYTAAYSG